jgi:predicted RNA-binding Zn ribbon-like protein
MPEPITPPPAPGEDVSTALALINTELEPRGEMIDLLPDGRALAGWLHAQGLTPRRAATISDEDLHRMRQLRSAIREAFTARAAGRRGPRSAMTTINVAAALVWSAPQLRWNDDGPVQQRIWAEDARSTDIALAEIAGNAIITLLGDRGARLRLCEAHGCNRMFIADHRRRRWCSRTCGDRVRVARHYRKHNRLD